MWPAGRGRWFCPSTLLWWDPTWSPASSSGVGWMVGLDDLRGLFQPMILWTSFYLHCSDTLNLLLTCVAKFFLKCLSLRRKDISNKYCQRDSQEEHYIQWREKLSLFRHRLQQEKTLKIKTSQQLHILNNQQIIIWIKLEISQNGVRPTNHSHKPTHLYSTGPFP